MNGPRRGGRGGEGFRIYLSLYAFDPFGINLGLIEFEANMEQGASMLAQTLAVPGWINMALCGDLKVLIVKQPVQPMQEPIRAL